MLRITIIIFFFLTLLIINVYAITNDSLDSKSILLYEKKNQKQFAPLEYFTKDTLFKTIEHSGFDKPGQPYKLRHTAFQDSFYYRAMRLKIPASVRLDNDFSFFARTWRLEREIEEGLPWQIALRNLNIRPDIYTPTGQEIVQRQIMIQNAFYVPFVSTYNPYGLQLPIADIGRFLGLLEDFSPVLEFDIDYTEEIEIVVYSMQAIVIATVFNGQRRAGHHKFVWNGRDDKGMPMPNGDYIGEIRIGKTMYKRKRIKIP